MKSRQFLVIAFFAIFLFLGLMALKEGMPTDKNERVYTILQKYIPYTLEKRVGGYSIVSKETGVKEKPPAKELFLRLELLEKLWAKDFLKLDGDTLIVLDKNKKEISKILLETADEKKWVKEYFEFK